MDSFFWNKKYHLKIWLYKKQPQIRCKRLIGKVIDNFSLRMNSFRLHNSELVIHEVYENLKELSIFTLFLYKDENDRLQLATNLKQSKLGFSKK